MTVNERVKMIRKSDRLNETEKMTLERFGERLGVTKVAISNIEKGNRALTEQMFKAICREFDVNPDWLRDGTGEMFKEKSRNDQIAEFIDDVLKNEPDGVKARLIAALSRLDNSDWERIALVAQSIVGDAPAADPLRFGSVSDDSAAKLQRERLHEELDRQLDEEEGAVAGSEASIAG